MFAGGVDYLTLERFGSAIFIPNSPFGEKSLQTQ